MNLPETIEGTYVSDRRTLEYWTQCEHCPEREDCKRKHTCDHPGWMRFLIEGKGSVGWSGIITLKKIARTVRDYLERDETKLPEDVYIPPRQMSFEEMNL